MAPRRFSLTDVSYLKGIIRMATSVWMHCDPAALLVQLYPTKKGQLKAMVIVMPTHEVVVSAGDFNTEAEALEVVCDIVEQKAFALTGIASKL